MRKRFSGSTLFLLELLLSIMTFALCAAVCLRVFAGARTMSAESDALNRAVALCESGAECFKAGGGDIGRAAELMGWPAGGEIARGCYDADWLPTDEAGAEYIVAILPGQTEGGLRLARVLAATAGGEEVFSLEVAAREGAR